MRILIIIPTTGGPLTVRSLLPRPALPASAAFAEGDYRPLPWSGDYAALVSAGGPLARSGAVSAGSFELRLDRSFDAGRSWEAPVALAHVLAARGHEITGDVANADMLLWTTGAIDLDLKLIAGRYALLDKVEHCGPLLAAARGLPVVMATPPDDEAVAAQAALATLAGRPPVIADGDLSAIADQIDALGQVAVHQQDNGQQNEPADEPKRSPLLLALAVGVLALATAGAMSVGLMTRVVQKPPPDAGQLKAGPAKPGPEKAESPDASAGPPPDVPKAAPPEKASQKQSSEESPPAKAAPVTEAPPLVRLEELRAPQGRDCAAVIFGAVQPVRVSVALNGQAFAASRYDASLCGLAFSPRDGAAADITVSAPLVKLTTTPAPLPNGGEIRFLRNGPRLKALYEIHVTDVSPGTHDRAQTLTHVLEP